MPENNESNTPRAAGLETGMAEAAALQGLRVIEL
jgi:hypothetical protein